MNDEHASDLLEEVRAMRISQAESREEMKTFMAAVIRQIDEMSFDIRESIAGTRERLGEALDRLVGN